MGGTSVDTPDMRGVGSVDPTQLVATPVQGSNYKIPTSKAGALDFIRGLPWVKEGDVGANALLLKKANNNGSFPFGQTLQLPGMPSSRISATDAGQQIEAERLLGNSAPVLFRGVGPTDCGSCSVAAAVLHGSL